MDIVIIANFCSALDKPANSRFSYIADLLAKENEVEIIGSAFSHEMKRKRECDFSRFSYKVTLIKEPGYRKNISVQRFLSHRVWGKNVLEYIQQRKKPNVVYCAIPSLTAAALVGKYCNSNGIRFVLDIQDLWPEAFRMKLNVPILSGIAFTPFRRRANCAYSAADAIVAVSQTYVTIAKSINKRANITAAVYIGTDLCVFDKYAKENKIIRQDDEFWIGYCGSMSDSYDIPCVVDAIRRLNNTKVRLIAMGDGYLKDEFQKYAAQAGISAEFTGYVNYPEMCGRLTACDVTVNPIRHKSAASIINKHADYAACGLPVINTQESEEYRNLVSDYYMGFNCMNGNAADMADKLSKLMANRKLCQEMGKNARKCAEEMFDRKKTYKRIINIIERSAKNI